MEDDFDFDIDYDINDDQPDSFMFDNTEYPEAPDGRQLSDKARMEVIQTHDGPEHHLYFGLRKTEQANYTVGQLQYDFKNLWNAFDDFKNGKKLDASKKLETFWTTPLEFPAIHAQHTVPYTHKELEKAALLEGVVPVSEVVLVNPPPGTIKRMADMHADTIPIVCTNQIEDQNYKDLRAMKKDIDYRGSLVMNPYFHYRDRKSVAYLGFVGTEIITQGPIMGFETNPTVGVMLEDYYTDVQQESDGYVLSFLRKGIKYRYKWEYDVNYKRVSPYVFYETMNGRRFITEKFNDRMKSSCFIYRDVPQLDQLFWENGKGKIISQDVFINGCDSVFYDVLNIGTYYDPLSDFSYKVVYTKEGPVDIAETPYVYSTRRTMLGGMFNILAKVYKNIVGMINPHRADNITNDIVKINVQDGDYYMKEKFEKGSIGAYYYKDIKGCLTKRYYCNNLSKDHYLYRNRKVKYDTNNNMIMSKKVGREIADVTQWFIELKDKHDVIYYKDDNIIGAGNGPPMIEVPMPSIGHYIGPKSKNKVLLSVDNKVCITDSVSVLDIFNSRRKGVIADTYFYGTLYRRHDYEDDYAVEGEYMDIDYSPILMEAYNFGLT